MKQSYPQLIALIKSDLYRYYRDISWKGFFKTIAKQRGFIITTLYRITRFCHLNQFKVRSIIAKLVFRLVKEFYNTDFSYHCSAGPGLRVMHLYGLTVGKGTVLGKNINLSHNVTLGSKLVNGINYWPCLEDNIVIGTGAVLIGKITVSSGAVVGPNVSMAKDIPENSVVVGNPGKIISYKGSAEHLSNIDYEDIIPNLPPQPDFRQHTTAACLLE